VSMLTPEREATSPMRNSPDAIPKAYTLERAPESSEEFVFSQSRLFRGSWWLIRARIDDLLKHQ